MKKLDEKQNVGRVSILGRIIDLLWMDDEFYREVSSLKKASSSNKFPRTDQWCDGDGFHMAFALAGYSVEDIEISFGGSELIISGSGNKMSPESFSNDAISEESCDDNDEDYPKRGKNKQIQQGIIVRGIARRSFRTKYYISPNFDLKMAHASMKDGLLEVIVPPSNNNDLFKIEINKQIL
jgi:HSP20 family molecular chaperone IbpA